MECPAVTPLPVLRASGHVERFTDLMVRDLRTNECHRADHLLEHALEAALSDSSALKLSDTRVEVGGLRDSHRCSLWGNYWRGSSETAQGETAKRAVPCAARRLVRVPDQDSKRL